MSKRLFVALKVPKKTNKLLMVVQDKFKEIVPDDLVKWVEPQNFHQTLVFLGQVEEPRIELLKKIISRLKRNSCLNLSLRRAGFFPDIRRPRVIYVDLDGQTTELSSCYHQLRMNLKKQGFDFDVRFSPHICLGRVRSAKSRLALTKKKVNKVNDILRETETDFVANKIVLFESKLTSKCPIYTPIFELCLGKQ